MEQEEVYGEKSAATSTTDDTSDDRKCDRLKIVALDLGWSLAMEFSWHWTLVSMKIARSENLPASIRDGGGDGGGSGVDTAS